MDDMERDTLIRKAAFEHVRRLSELHGHLTEEELSLGFSYEGARVPLIRLGHGIHSSWNPQIEKQDPWRGLWLRHPCPTAFELAEEICRLARREEDGEEAENPAAVQGYAFASLHVADRFFLNVRYKVNTLDRHRPTATIGRTWNVYHQYNPG